jgi:hypothetical protein
MFLTAAAIVAGFFLFNRKNRDLGSKQVRSSSSEGRTEKPEPRQRKEDKATKEKVQQEQATKKTPLERFKHFVAKMQQELPTRFPLRGTNAELTYDVRKTDSLVSPLTAVMVVRWSEKLGNGRASPDQQLMARCDYAFQDDRWVFKGARVETTNVADFSEDLRDAFKASTYLYQVDFLLGCEQLLTSSAAY